MIRYKFLVPVSALLVMAAGGFIYMQSLRDMAIHTTTLSGQTYIQETDVTQDISTTSTTSTDTTVTTSDTTDDALLQQKLIEAESALTNLSNYANQEVNVTI